MLLLLLLHAITAMLLLHAVTAHVCQLKWSESVVASRATSLLKRACDKENRARACNDLPATKLLNLKSNLTSQLLIPATHPHMLLAPKPLYRATERGREGIRGRGGMQTSDGVQQATRPCPRAVTSSLTHSCRYREARYREMRHQMVRHTSQHRQGKERHNGKVRHKWKTPIKGGHAPLPPMPMPPSMPPKLYTPFLALGASAHLAMIG